jgi:hypothetical protein
MKMAVGLSIILSVGALTVSGPGAFADTVPKALREAVSAGEVVPLTRLLDWLDRHYYGQIIDVDLELRDGRLIYGIELLGPQGQLVRFFFDARRGELLQIEGVRLAEMRKDEASLGRGRPGP